MIRVVASVPLLLPVLVLEVVAKKGTEAEDIMLMLVVVSVH